MSEEQKSKFEEQKSMSEDRGNKLGVKPTDQEDSHVSGKVILKSDQIRGI